MSNNECDMNKRPTHQKTRLSSGLTIITEHITHVRSVSIGIWLRTGTRYEHANDNGVAHFLEHMMFKATRRRSAREIVRRIESLGGNLNAFTSKEQTCYHVEILDEHLPKAIDLLADVLNRADFSEKEMEKERLVILDEIQSVEDTPDEVVQELYAEKLYPDHALGYPILGTEESVKRLDLSALWQFYASQYASQRAIVSVSGNVNHARLVELVNKHVMLPSNGASNGFYAPANFGAGEVVVERPISQAHICMGVPSYGFNHDRKFDLLVLNVILGGGMGSRLFQNIRERHGIAYGIYSFLDFYHDSGTFGVYLGTDTRNLTRAMKMLDHEFTRLMEKPVSLRELRDAKSYLKGNMMLGLESTAARMNRLAMLEIYLGEFKSIDRVLENIDRVTRESVMATAGELLVDERRLNVILKPDK